MRVFFLLFLKIAFVFFSGALTFYLLGFKVNTSDSIPKGLYRITPTSTLKNKYVIFCPQKNDVLREAIRRGYIDKGFCVSSSEYLMKKIVATYGDVVTSNSKGVYINGKKLAYSIPKIVDGANRLLPKWRVHNYKLKKNEVLTMTDQDEWSFDARYYGLIKTQQIKGVIAPIWVKPLEIATQ